MKAIVRILTALALAAATAAAYADPPGRVARLNFIAGPVSFAPGEAPEHWVGAVINRPLTGGDRLWADRDARAELHVGSTAIRMAPGTSVDVLHLDDDRLQLRLAQGAVNVRVRDLDADDLVEIATPAGAVILAEPGSYRVSADPHSDVVRVAVNFGRAELVTAFRSAVVPSGQTAVLAGNAPPVYEIAAHAGDEFDRWSAERDRREDRVASTRYVSPHMTGYEDLDHHGTWQTLPEYGAVWTPARVDPGWAPYRNGHWAWVSPWGWTWIDEAPWGFAPFHYGRWVWVHDRWAWAPGAIVRRPVYAPALVAFVGGAGWSLSVHSGPAVGWFPLGWREPYRPWYRASPVYVRNVNVSHVTNVYNTTHVAHVHRNRPGAVTVVPQQAFASARPVRQTRLSVDRDDLSRAQVVQDRLAIEPTRASIAPERRGQRPPQQAVAREVVVSTPPAAARSRLAPDAAEAGGNAAREADTAPRVRAIARDRGEWRRADGREQPERRAVAPAATPPAAEREARPAAIPAPPAMAAPARRSEPRAEATPPAPAAAAPEPRRMRRDEPDAARARWEAQRLEQQQRARVETRRPEPQRERVEVPRERPRFERPPAQAQRIQPQPEREREERRREPAGRTSEPREHPQARFTAPPHTPAQAQRARPPEGGDRAPRAGPRRESGRTAPAS